MAKFEGHFGRKIRIAKQLFLMVVLTFFSISGIRFTEFFKFREIAMQCVIEVLKLMETYEKGCININKKSFT